MNTSVLALAVQSVHDSGRERQAGVPGDETSDEHTEFQVRPVSSAHMYVIAIGPCVCSAQEVSQVWQILAAILNAGNLQMEADKDGSKVVNQVLKARDIL